MHFPLFILPCDHRNGLAKDVLNTTYPFSPSNLVKAKELKQMVLEAILAVRQDYTGTGTLACLFDEETGLEAIMAAEHANLPVAISMEKSGTSTLELIHGDQYATHLSELHPNFGKLLVNYQLSRIEENAKQRQIIKQVSDACEAQGIPLMLEILLHEPSGHTPADMLKVFAEMHADGIKVGVWKIEGFDQTEDWLAVAPQAKAPMIVLGRGQNATAVATWVQAAAKSGVVDGFAIGRTIFQDALTAYAQKTLSRPDAIQSISNRYRGFIHLWESNSLRT